MEDRRFDSENIESTITFCLQECEEILDYVLPRFTEKLPYAEILATVFVENLLNIRNIYN